MLVNLKIELARKGWTDTKLSEETGITRSHISNIINGKAGISLNNAIKIKDVLQTDVPLEELFADVAV